MVIVVNRGVESRKLVSLAPNAKCDLELVNSSGAAGTKKGSFQEHRV